MNKVTTQPSAKTSKKETDRPRLLIEEWLPAQAIGVECMRARGSASALEPHVFLHVWWARRPLTISRAAVLASLLPADFDRSRFERLLGFYASSTKILAGANLLIANADSEERISNPHGTRAFTNAIPPKDIEAAHKDMEKLWGGTPTIIDPMAGGGSIPLEAARLGLNVLANEYNPVACSILEATVDYPFRFGADLAEKARKWGNLWRQRFNDRMKHFYEVKGIIPARTFIFARTVPCPDTGYPTPLVPDWSLLRPKRGVHVVAEPVVLNKKKGNWTIRVCEVGRGAGKLSEPPQPTFGGGSGISLFTGNPIPGDYIKAMAQKGEMGSVLYAVATKPTKKLEFRPAEPTDLKALAAAEKELVRLQRKWKKVESFQQRKSRRETKRKNL